jgi:copper chaperone CopZ
METIEVRVGGMTCDGCERGVARALERLPGVRAVRADHSTGRVSLDADRVLPEDEVRAAVEDAGYVYVPPGSVHLPTL